MVLRRSPPRGRRSSRARTRRAGSPWSAGAARTGAQAQRRSTPGVRRSPSSQLLGGLRASEAGADDDECLLAHVVLPSGQGEELAGVSAGRRGPVRAASMSRSWRRTSARRAATYTDARPRSRRRPPLAAGCACSQPAIWVVSRSCSWRLRANSSTTRASFERPTMRSADRRTAGSCPSDSALRISGSCSLLRRDWRRSYP